MNQKNMYSPCSCGSGKKYKFCCYQKQSAPSNVRGLAEFWANDSDDVFNKSFPGLEKELYRKVIEKCRDGLELMASGRYKEAIPILKKAVPLCADIYTPANNLALCQFVTGKLGDAIKTQRQALAASRFPNPFGMVNLSTFCYANGEEEEAKRLLDEAVGLKPPSSDACTKVCEGLARFKRHQDILAYADANEYGDFSNISFYTGVAAANLGDIDRARCDLDRVDPRTNKTDMARRYLDHLRSGTAPDTVLGDWPYLLPEEVCPFEIVKTEMKCTGDAWFERRILVDFGETLLNDKIGSLDGAMDVLREAKHPKSIVLLLAIMKGSFGPDSIRLQAIRELRQREAIDLTNPIKVFLKGKYEEVKLSNTALNYDFRFAPELPEKWEKVYIKALKDGMKTKPDWKAIGENYLKILEAVPEFFPAYFNYAVGLVNQKCPEEAEPIFRELIQQHPAYLFATAALLQLLCSKKRLEEAAVLIEEHVTPVETHPDAMGAWFLAQYIFFATKGEYDAAAPCLEQAHEIIPDHPHVKALWKAYTDPI